MALLSFELLCLPLALELIDHFITHILEGFTLIDPDDGSDEGENEKSNSGDKGREAQPDGFEEVYEKLDNGVDDDQDAFCDFKEEPEDCSKDINSFFENGKD